MTKESLLKILNLKFRTKFQSTENLIAAHPRAIVYITHPTEDEFLSFFKRIVSRPADNISFSNEFMDAVVLKALRKYPDMFKENNYLVKTLAQFPRVLNAIHMCEKHLADRLFMKVILVRSKSKTKYEQELLAYIDNPSNRMKMYASMYEPSSVRLMKDVKDRVILEAVKRDPSVIRFVKRPSDDVRKTAITADYRTLGLLEDQSKADCKLALSISPKAFEFVRPGNRYEEMLTSVLEVDSDLDWLDGETFSKYRFSIEEIEKMAEMGSLKLVAFLALLDMAGRIDIPETLSEKIKNKIYGGE